MSTSRSKHVIILSMKKLLLSGLVAIIGILLLGMICYYFVNYQNTHHENSDQRLIGIWQESPSMAAGWADRYHFYANHRFHYLPSEMIVEGKVTEKIGKWEHRDSKLILRVSLEITSDRTHEGEIISDINRTHRIYEIPEVEILSLYFLEADDGNLYPSVMIGKEKYYRFSSDPSRYGDEKYFE